ncbi:MAG: UDP-N-acetylmuramate--L-alanine ligase [Burkholderiales bacterium]|nr:UDP-N-acetylmuramate--L-alanine ligase [Burkholderiales bacterium]
MNAKRPHDHFVGIGGAGMSAIAEVLHALGHRVSGSDRSDSAVARRLAALGIEVHIGHDAAHAAGADRVVTSTAIGADNPEVVGARAAGIPVVARAAVLGELMQRQRGIAIAGTHGKTTTTSLVASALVAAGADPSYVIGGELLAAGSHARLGRGAWLVAEADESDASFLHLSPAVAVVTNIDADHMETYGHELARLHEAFVTFIHRLPADGRAVMCSDDAGVRAVLPRIARPLTTYGLGADADLRAVDVQALPGARMQFIARAAGHPDLSLTLNLAGEHNVRNALATLAVTRAIGLPDAPVALALAEFAGVGRRFQRWGDMPASNGGHYTLIDDYGHHPVEIAAVLEAARGAFPGRRLVLAFQPHRYTRTRDCLADFATVLGRFDALLLTEVYAAGEAPIAGADGRTLAQACGGGAVFVADIDALPAALQATARDGDVVITMGAGSIAGAPPKLAAMRGNAP